MRSLAAVEQFFERLFERPTARLFRTRLQPIQLQRRIERAMETERRSGAQRTAVPNRYRVRLHPDDLVAFSEIGETLAAELADAALQFARGHRYALADRPRVDLMADPSVERGEIAVDTRFADPGPAKPRGMTATDEDAAATADAAAEGHATRTMVFDVPKADVPTARLRVVRPDGSQQKVALDAATLTIGRAGDNGLVLQDPRVSRHHARLQARRGTLVLTDLASTNGSRVNGSRVAEVVLGEGDRIELGDTVLVVETAPDR